jgi:hypothetical protein
MCSGVVTYISKNTGQQVAHKGQSVIHGAIEWKNPFTWGDDMHCYIAGYGQEANWKMMKLIFDGRMHERTKARELVNKELTSMFHNRTFNCQVCLKDTSMMKQYAHTNGIVYDDRDKIRCKFEACQQCLGKLKYKIDGGHICFECPSCVALKKKMAPIYQDSPIWFEVKYLSMENNKRYDGPRIWREILMNSDASSDANSDA